MAFVAGEDLGVGPFLPADAKDFCCSGSVPQPIDSFDRGPPALDKEAENLPCLPQYLLRALLLLRRPHPNIQHPDPHGWVLRDVLFGCVLSWWFFGRKLSCSAGFCKYRACHWYVYGDVWPDSKSLRNTFHNP